MLFLTKRKCLLPLSTSHDVMYHKGFLGLKSFFHFHMEATISEFIKRLNGSQSDHHTTMLRLIQFQINNLLVTLIFDYVNSELTIISTPPYSNLSYDCLRAARHRGITI